MAKKKPYPKGRAAINPPLREEWSPSELHLLWYKKWTVDYLSMTDIAREHGVSRQSVHAAVHNVSDWLRTTMFDQILEFRHRQTDTLESIAKLALNAYHASVGKVKITTKKKVGGKIESVTEREEVLNGDQAYLAEARAALADIRRIWGVDKPQKLEVSHVDDDGTGLLRVAGLPREEAIRKQAEFLLQTAENLKANGGKSAGAVHATNGHTNGHVNGHTNGHVNGSNGNGSLS